MKSPRAVLCSLALTLPLCAFAGKDEAQLALTSARANLAAAERADAARYANPELGSARDMLARAEGSFESRDWRDAEHEAMRAKADARLAEAVTRQRRSEALLTEMEATLRSLRNEIDQQGAR